jgi:hypothetical protein
MPQIVRLLLKQHEGPEIALGGAARGTELSDWRRSHHHGTALFASKLGLVS